MIISKNIIYDSEAVKNSEHNFHTNQLEVVSLNLDDFNSRFNSNIILQYNHIWNVFLLQTKNELYGNIFSRHISYCLAFYNDANWDEVSFISKDLRLIEDVMFNLYYHITQRTESFKMNDELNSELNLFIKRYDNFFPLGILSKMGEIYYRKELQIIVDKLKSVFIHLD